jgi:hypothetical protein
MLENEMKEKAAAELKGALWELLAATEGDIYTDAEEHTFAVMRARIAHDNAKVVLTFADRYL